MKLSPYTIHNNTSLPRDVLKSIAEPPDLPWRHLFEPGAGCEIENQFFFRGIEGYVYLQFFFVLGPFVTEQRFWSLPRSKH